MKYLDLITATPVIISVTAATDIVLRGKAFAQDMITISVPDATSVPIQPVVGLMILGGFLLSGLAFLMREMLVESQDSRRSTR